MSDSLTDITAVLCTYYNHLCGSLSPWLLAIFLITINTASVSLLETAERLAYPLEITVAGQIIFFLPAQFPAHPQRGWIKPTQYPKLRTEANLICVAFVCGTWETIFFYNFKKKKKSTVKLCLVELNCLINSRIWGGRNFSQDWRSPLLGGYWDYKTTFIGMLNLEESYFLYSVYFKWYICVEALYLWV